MKPDNDWYGHKRVLSDYCGYENKKSVFGYIPHGWEPAWTAEHGRRRIKQAPLFVWNQRLQEQAQSFGLANVICIGAPYIYAVHMLLGEERPTGLGTIAFPSHSAEGTQIGGEMDSFIREVESKCPPPYTVSVFYQDLQKEVVNLYRDAGWKIVSFGTRADDQFLYRQLKEIARHEHVVGNLLQTALWYGGFLGKSIRLIGDRPKILSISKLHSPESVKRDLDRHLIFEDRFSGIRGEGLNAAVAQNIAAHELGAEFKRSPKELSQILGWTSPWRTTASIVLRNAYDLRYGRNLRRGHLKR